ncbi:replicative DNA helicase [Streptomyces sp. NPDC055962]|uniref:replicative DNA helicase n=1 Tax=Streptomyces sp. NPDC055962 TaxID=3345667 RepID=UPI0035DB078B
MPSERDVPAGPHRDLLSALHDAYRAAGRPGLRQIAAGVKNDDRAPATLNYQAIGKILNGKQLPSPRQLVSLAAWLIREGNIGRNNDENNDEGVKKLLEHLEAAHRSAHRREETEDYSAHSDIIRSTLAAEAHIERALLSCMMRSESALAAVIEDLAPEVFADEVNRAIYLSLLGLYADNEEVTPQKVTQEVSPGFPGRDTEKIIEAILDDSIDPDEAAACVAFAKRIAEVKRVALLGATLTNLAGRSISKQGEPDVESLVDSVEDEVLSYMEEIHNISTVGRKIIPVLDEVEGINKRTSRPVLSGFRHFDLLSSGFRPGELTILGGASGIGKSTLGLDFIRNCSIAQSQTSFLASLQMSRDEMAMRIMSAEARVPLQAMRSSEMTDEQWKRVAAVMPKISQAPLYMEDDPTYSFRSLISSCEWLVNFKNLRLVVIDSIDLLELDSTAEEAKYSFSRIGRELRKEARRLEIPIVALFQTERSTQHYSSTLPSLRDIPDSLEKHADRVVLLHREDAYERESPRAGEADLVIAKNRTGPTGVATIAFQGHYARFMNIA